MADLKLKGSLNLRGTLVLAARNGGTVKAGNLEKEILVEVGRDGTTQGNGIPVIQPPNAPIDPDPFAKVIQSFNTSVKIRVRQSELSSIVALGITAQGSQGTWPGIVIVLDSVENKSGPTINQIPINVVGDQAITLANGGTINFSESGQ